MEVKHSSPLVYRVYEEMKKHVGKENAISGVVLSRKLGITERQLRECVREIRQSTELEKVIASGNTGYYLCKNKDEYMKARDRLRSTALDLLTTLSALDKKVGQDGQMKIMLGEFYKDTFHAMGE